MIREIVFKNIVEIKACNEIQTKSMPTKLKLKLKLNEDRNDEKNLQ